VRTTQHQHPCCLLLLLLLAGRQLLLPSQLRPAGLLPKLMHLGGLLHTRQQHLHQPPCLLLMSLHLAGLLHTHRRHCRQLPRCLLQLTVQLRKPWSQRLANCW
jgi:hypothetical protein